MLVAAGKMDSAIKMAIRKLTKFALLFKMAEWLKFEEHELLFLTINPKND